MHLLQQLVVIAYALFSPVASGASGHLRIQRRVQSHLMSNLSNVKQPINAAEFSEDVYAKSKWPPGVANAKCHPICVWHCTDPVCDQTCEPVCKAPNCQVHCPKLTLDFCAETCEEPDCAVVCPKKECEMQECKSCNTVCKKASCKMQCSAPPCHSVCEDPHCEWVCKKPEKCPEPDCQMQCQQPKGCMIGGPTRPLPENVDSIIHSQAIAKLDESIAKPLESPKPLK